MVAHDSVPAWVYRLGRILGYVLLGILTTAATALGVLYVTRPLQTVVYNVFYLQVGPATATTTAILTQFIFASTLALSVTLFVADYIATRGANRRPLAVASLGTLGVVVVFLVISLVGLAAFLTAILVLALAFLLVPLGLWYHYRVHSGAIPAFVGGIPVVVLALLLAGFGIGWGWGYTMTAHEVPGRTVDDPVATFDDVPQVRADLFDDDFSTDADGDRVYRLELRGYEHVRQATLFMAQHGVRCPYSGASASFIARYNNSFYRITCTPHGD